VPVRHAGGALLHHAAAVPARGESVAAGAGRERNRRMTDAFVNQLRTRGGVIELASPGGPAITVRVEMPEVWDVVRLRVSPDERILLVKLRALEALNPGGE